MASAPNPRQPAATRIPFMGDVVGRTGRETPGPRLGRLRPTPGIDFAIVKAEYAW
jgi:calcineurin-like phosphoesterase